MKIFPLQVSALWFIHIVLPDAGIHRIHSLLLNGTEINKLNITDLIAYIPKYR